MARLGYVRFVEAFEATGVTELGRNPSVSSLTEMGGFPSVRFPDKNGKSGHSAIGRRSIASTAAVPVLAAIQPLHGFTFALLHLTAMHLIARVVPQRLSASAQTIYGTLGLGWHRRS